MSITVKPTQPQFFAEISGIDLAQPLTAADRDAIVAAIARMHDGFPAAESSGGTTRVGFSLHAA